MRWVTMILSCYSTFSFLRRISVLTVLSYRTLRAAPNTEGRNFLLSGHHFIKACILIDTNTHLIQGLRWRSSALVINFLALLVSYSNVVLIFVTSILVQLALDDFIAPSNNRYCLQIRTRVKRINWVPESDFLALGWLWPLPGEVPAFSIINYYRATPDLTQY